MMNRKLAIVEFGVAALVPALGVAAASARDAGDREIQLAPLYLWAIHPDGSITIRWRDAPVEVSFGDTFDNLDSTLRIEHAGPLACLRFFW